MAKPSPTQLHPTLLRVLGLHDLPKGRGRAHAVIVWLRLAAAMGWSRGSRDVYLSNARIARDAGLSIRAVERAIALLRDGGKLGIRYGRRTTKIKPGRILTLHFPGAVIPCVRFPPRTWCRDAWRLARTARERPASVVALAVAAYVWTAACARDKAPGERACRVPMASLRALTGATHGGAFQARLGVLEHLGILWRAGDHWRDGLGVAADLGPACDRFGVTDDAINGKRVARAIRRFARDRLVVWPGNDLIAKMAAIPKSKVTDAIRWAESRRLLTTRLKWCDDKPYPMREFVMLPPGPLARVAAPRVSKTRRAG